MTVQLPPTQSGSKSALLPAHSATVVSVQPPSMLLQLIEMKSSRSGRACCGYGGDAP